MQKKILDYLCLCAIFLFLAWGVCVIIRSHLLLFP